MCSDRILDLDLNLDFFSRIPVGFIAEIGNLWSDSEQYTAGGVVVVVVGAVDGSYPLIVFTLLSFYSLIS